MTSMLQIVSGDESRRTSRPPKSKVGVNVSESQKESGELDDGVDDRGAQRSRRLGKGDGGLNAGARIRSRGAAWRLPLALSASAFLVFMSGCYRYHTVTTFKDPSLVEVRLPDGADSEKPVLAAGASSATADTPAGPVELSRDSRGSIQVGRGEVTKELLDANGQLQTEVPPSVETPEFRVKEEVMFPVGEQTITYLGNVTRIDQDVLVLEPVVATPWTNVGEIVEKRTPKRSVGGLLFPGTIFLVIGGVLVAVGEELTGGLLAVGGLATDGVGVYFLVAPPKRTTIYPSSTP